MDDYCFRKIKSTALVMIALAAVHIAISNPLGYYWNALQAELSGVQLTVSGVPAPGDQSQSMVIYLLMFGTIALLAFITSPRRTSIWWRLILIAPLSVYLFSAYTEYRKISPISEKFKDLYESLEYAIFVPYAAIAAATALYILFVIVLPAFRITQAMGWAVSVVAILAYLVSAVFIVYNHTMTILDGSFGQSEFYTYLIAFVLDVVSYFFMLSVLMTYCTIKREERWDVLEALAMQAEQEEDQAETRAIREPAEPVSPAAPAAQISERVIPDIEDLKEHEGTFTCDYGEYLVAPSEPATSTHASEKKDAPQSSSRQPGSESSDPADEGDRAAGGQEPRSGRRGKGGRHAAGRRDKSGQSSRSRKNTRKR
jgi:uncharacterized integral membrane protein